MKKKTETSQQILDRLRARAKALHPYDIDRADATCVNEADFDSSFVQNMLATDDSIFDEGDQL